MITLLPTDEIRDLAIRQLTGFFPLDADETRLIGEAMPSVLARCERCFLGVENKYYRCDGEARFNPFHSSQWLTFLYFLANTLSTAPEFEAYPGHKILADKVYYLNKIMNGVDIYHEVRLPEVFFFEHPLGTVVGRADIGDGLRMYQGCTIGGNFDKEGHIHYPRIGRNFSMYANSKILGRCHVGDNVTLAANTYVKDTDLPDGATVFGSSPSLTIKT